MLIILQAPNSLSIPKIYRIESFSPYHFLEPHSTKISPSIFVLTCLIIFLLPYG